MDARLAPYRLGYVVLSVEDLAAATKWWTRYGQLEVSESSRSRVYLRGGTDHHWIVLERAGEGTGVPCIAFEVEDADSLDAYRRRLAAAGAAVSDFLGDSTGPGIRFADPDGYQIELFTSMGIIPVAPSEPLVPPRELLHAALAVADLNRSTDFYTRVLGMAESDRVADRTVFLRGGVGWHHSLALGAGRSQLPKVEHICLQMADLDELMRVRARLLADGQPLSGDLMRHGPSSSIAFYAPAEPASTTVEYCIEHALIVDPHHRPGVFTSGPRTTNVWLPPVQ